MTKQPEHTTGTGSCGLPCKRLILVRGVPGSGKTTYAKKLGIKDHYEADMWFDQNGAYDPNQIRTAHKWCRIQAMEAMKAGRPVVVSNTFTQLWELEPYKIAAAKYGYRVEEVVMKGKWPNVRGVPEKTVQKMRERFEYASDRDHVRTEAHRMG